MQVCRKDFNRKSSRPGEGLRFFSLRLMLLCAVFLTVAFSAGQRRPLVVAAWNVENLFDTLDDPDCEGDDPYSPGGWVHWSENRYNGKIERLADVIAGIKPDILCLSEVENKRVLLDLTTRLQKNHNLDIGHIVHRDGEDFRGIDVAVIARFEPKKKCWFNAVSGQRDILACTFEIDSRELTVVANHWKSKLGNSARSDAIRERQARSVREYLKRELAVDPGAAILVAGDFNSDFNSTCLTESAGFLTSLEELRKPSNASKLYNLAAELASDERGTYYYVRARRWNSFDSISVTRGMVGIDLLAPWRVRDGSYTVYKPEQITFRDVGTPLPYRRIRSKKYGDRFVEGYSDHFAVFVVLE